MYATTTAAISADLPYNATLAGGETMTLGTSPTLHFSAGSINDLTLKSGQTIVLYISNPDSVSVNDVGLTVSIGIFSAQAMYYREANIEAVTI